MKLKIEIRMDNAAFEPCNGEEAARILERLAVRWRGENMEPGETCRLMDLNGNPVGEAKVSK